MKIVVAYSGGLDTSVLLKWLKEKYNAEIIAYCADVGQAEELDGLEAKALATGASKCFIGDLKEDFATNYIFPMMQANALYEGRYLLGTSIARPCISKDMVDLAIREGADAIAHGATGKGDDQERCPGPHGNDRLRGIPRHPDPTVSEKALFHGPQPASHFL